MSDPAPLVGVLVGSAAELPLMQQATAILEKLELPHEIRVMSSSRSPDLVDEYARTAFDRGLKVLVCTTGISGHLAAAVAARTIVPVVGERTSVLNHLMNGWFSAMTSSFRTGSPSRLTKYSWISPGTIPSWLARLNANTFPGSAARATGVSA